MADIKIVCIFLSHKLTVTIRCSLIGDCMQANESAIEEVGLSADVAGQRGLRMLAVLSYVFSAHFQHVNILRHMIALLSFDEDYVAPYILKAFTYLGRYKPLVDSFPEVLEELGPICKEMALSGTPKQAKHAVRCMFVNMVSAEDNELPESIANLFAELVEALKNNLHVSHPHYRTAIVSLGHIAYNMPEKYLVRRPFLSNHGPQVHHKIMSSLGQHQKHHLTQNRQGAARARHSDSRQETRPQDGGEMVRRGDAIRGDALQGGGP